MVKLLCSFIAVISLAACNNAGETPKEAESTTNNVSVAEAAAAKPVPLAEAKIENFQLKLKVGDTFKYKVTQENNTDSQQEVTRQKTTHVYKQRVLAVNADGSYDVGMEFVSIVQDVKSTDPKTGGTLFEQHFDSKDTANFNDVKNAHLAAPIGIEVVITLDKNSKFIRAKGVDKVVEKIISKTPNFPMQYKEQLGEQITTVMYATFSTQEYLQYPDKKLDSTYSWVITTKSPLSDIFDLASSTISKVTGVKKLGNTRLAEVSADIKGEIVARTQPADFPVSITINKSGMNGSLNALIDADRGTTVTKQYTINMNVSGTVLNKATKAKQAESKSNYLFYKIELIN